MRVGTGGTGCKNGVGFFQKDVIPEIIVFIMPDTKNSFLFINL